MAEISKINVNGTEYDIRSSFPTIQLLEGMSSPGLNFGEYTTNKPYNIYGKIYKINFEIEVPLNGSKTFTLEDPKKGTQYEIVSGEGIVVTNSDYIISRMTSQNHQIDPISLGGLKYFRESSSDPLKLQFTNNTSATTTYESTVKYYIELTLYERTIN